MPKLIVSDCCGASIKVIKVYDYHTICTRCWRMDCGTVLTPYGEMELGKEVDKEELKRVA